MIKITNLNLQYKQFTVEFLRSSGDVFCAVKNCRMVQGQKGAFISGPAIKTKDDKWFNLTYFDQKIQADIMEAYNAAVMAADVMEEENPVLGDDQEIPF